MPQRDGCVYAKCLSAKKFIDPIHYNVLVINPLISRKKNNPEIILDKNTQVF